MTKLEVRNFMGHAAVNEDTAVDAWLETLPGPLPFQFATEAVIHFLEFVDAAFERLREQSAPGELTLTESK